jgi:LysR family glycine cleavage system transcriptional activator
LRAFAAAARHENLRLGAADLGITPSAVSHHVRAIEEWLGTPLFVPVGRSVRLTPAGRDLAVKLTGALDALSAALTDARAEAADIVLRVSALPMFTNVWLIPRLGEFEAAHLGLTIEIDTSSRLVDFDRDEVDVAIRNSAKPAAALTAHKLLDLRAVPLCTPEVAKRLLEPKDLRHVTLIHLAAGTRGWPNWLSGAGVADLKPRAHLSFDTLPAVLEAASQGHGVMIGLDPLVFDAPAAHGLVAPFGFSRYSAGAYYLVHRKDGPVRPAVHAFAEWIVQEMRADRSRLRAISKAAIGGRGRLI